MIQVTAYEDIPATLIERIADSARSHRELVGCRYNIYPPGSIRHAVYELAFSDSEVEPVMGPMGSVVELPAGEGLRNASNGADSARSGGILACMRIRDSLMDLFAGPVQPAATAA